MSIDICKLCLKENDLKMGHIIPKFVTDWIKDTSVTGFLRSKETPDKRMEDGIKKLMFCDDCETLLSKYEKKFAEKIFVPYVTKELDAWGIKSNKINSFEYDEWLLNFAISLQFRYLVINDGFYTEYIDERKSELIKEQMEYWRNFILGNSGLTGKNRTYILFLGNVAFYQGTEQIRFGSKVNNYILRSVDAQLMSSRNTSDRLLIYTKLGPIFVYTSILPQEIKNMKHTQIRKKGIICVKQDLNDSLLNNYIFHEWPEILDREVVYSKKQQDKITKDVLKNEVRFKNSLATKAYLSDQLIKEINMNI